MGGPSSLSHTGRLLYLAYFGYTGLVLVFLVLPLLAIIPLSFNASSFLTYPLEGVSLRWYAEVMASDNWMRAASNSLIVGAGCTVLSVVLGVMAAVGLSRPGLAYKSVLFALLISPMIVPVIISAVSVFFFFARIGLANSLIGITLAHTILATPFVVISVSASLQSFDYNLMRAAFSLGASPVRAFFVVMLPIIAPGVLTGALFAFATSLDEIVMVIFLSGPGQRTLPREMFDGLRENISPAIIAVATLLVLLASGLMVAAEGLRRRSEKRRLSAIQRVASPEEPFAG